jgi:hypothetical protein
LSGAIRDGDPDNFADGRKLSDLKQRSRLTAARRFKSSHCQIEKSGAGEGIRTLDPDLGKVVLYH